MTRILPGLKMERLFAANPLPVLPVILSALLVQTIYLMESRNDPTFQTPIIDARVYHEAAVRFADGEPLFHGAYWQPPLFPYFLGCIYRVFGVHIIAAKIVLALLAVADCVLIQWITGRMYSRPLGVVAGLLTAFCGPLLFFSTRLLPVGLATFLLLLALALWIRCLASRTKTESSDGRGVGAGRPLGWLAFGLTTGLAALAVPNAIVLLLPAVAGIVVTGFRQHRHRTMLLSGWMVLVGGVIPIGIVTLRNHHVSGEWVFISTNGGINFYLGNNPHRAETIAIRPGEKWLRLSREGYDSGVRTPAGRSRYFFRRSVRYIADEPLDFLSGLGRKGLQLINARELPRNVDPYVHREFSRLLSALLWRNKSLAFPFGLFAPLAAVGVVASFYGADRTGEQRQARWALLAFAVVYGFSVAVFFVTSRYRLPVEVATLSFTAYGAYRIGLIFYPNLLPFPRPGRRVLVALFLAATMVVNLPLRAATDDVDFRAELDMCIGYDAYGLGDLTAAERFLRKALDRKPHYVDAACKLAEVLAQQGDPSAAERLLRDASTWDPHALDPLVLEGELARQRNRPDEAREAFRKALVIDSTAPRAHAGLATLLVDEGRMDEAIEHLKIAADVAAHPGRYLIRLGDLLAQRQSYAEAIERYRQALWWIEPPPEVQNRIAWLLATCPVVELRDCRRAIEIAEHLCQITHHQHAVAMDTLAAAYAQCRRWKKAVIWARRAYERALATNDQRAAETIRTRLEQYEQRLVPQKSTTNPPKSVLGKRLSEP